MYWDQQLGTGAVPGCAALASSVSLLQAMGTLSTGISKMKGNVQHPLDLTWSHWSHLHQCPSGCLLDKDGPLEVLLVPAHCQDTYQGWISFYCWAPSMPPSWLSSREVTATGTRSAVKLPLSEERSCFLLFPLKSLSRSLAGGLWQDGTARAHELRPPLPRAPAALRAPGDWPLSHRRRERELHPGHCDKPTHGHVQLGRPVHGEELCRHDRGVLEILRLPDGERDDIGVVRVESHQQALQRAAALPGGLCRELQLQLPQRPGGAVHLPEPPPLLPQLHPGAASVLRPARRCAPGHDHRTHLPHPLPCHPGHLAQQGRQGAGLELPSRPASGHGPAAAGPPGHPNRPRGSRGHQAALLSRPVPPAPSPRRGPGLNASPPTPGAGSSAARALHGPGPGQLPPPAPRQVPAVGNAPAGHRGQHRRQNRGCRPGGAGL